MAKVIIPDKICPHCGGNEWQVRIVKNKPYYFCYNRQTEITNNWRLNNKEKYTIKTLKWRNNNLERYKKSLSKKSKNKVSNLDDTYIRHLLAKNANRGFEREGLNIKVSNSDITNEQISNYKEGIMEIRSLIKIKPLKSITMNKYEKILKLEQLHLLLVKPEDSLYGATQSANNKKSQLKREFGLRSVEDVEEAIKETQQAIAEELAILIESGQLVTYGNNDSKLNEEIVILPIEEVCSPTQIAIKTLQKIENTKKEIREYMNKIEQLLQTI